MERCFSRCAYIAIQDGEPLTIIQRAWSFEIESFISQICGKAFLWGGVHILILSESIHLSSSSMFVSLFQQKLESAICLD